MNDIRRSILWVVFGFSMVMLWDQWQVANGNPATFFPAPKPAATASAPAATGAATPMPQAAGATPAVTPGATPPSGAAPASKSERFTVTTDVVRLTFDTEGGSVVGAEFLQHAADAVDGKQTPARFVLL
jgi:YidC/Oxa1 family membrane protein insertase